MWHPSQSCRGPGRRWEALCPYKEALTRSEEIGIGLLSFYVFIVLGAGVSLGFGEASAVFPGESRGVHWLLAAILGIFNLSDPTNATGTIL